jgi:RimJ/RimL family protein N-acetyltransferase
MQLGRVLRKFCTRDGQEVILRTPRWEDLDNLMELINSLVDEKAEIARTEKVTREQEAEWLPRMLSSLEKDELFFLVAEVDGELVGSSDMDILRGDEKHVGVLGIVIKKGFREVGIGTEMMKTLVDQATALGLKLLMLHVFATNERAIHVYENVGFVQTGRIPKKHLRQGQYMDEVVMTKLIE